MDQPLKGTVRGRLLTTLTGLDFGTCDLRYALLGLVEPGSIVEPIEYPGTDQAVVALTGGRRAWLDLGRGLVLRESIPLPEGDVLLRELGEYRRQDALYLPRRVEIRQARCLAGVGLQTLCLQQRVGRQPIATRATCGSDASAIRGYASPSGPNRSKD